MARLVRAPCRRATAIVEENFLLLDQVVLLAQVALYVTHALDRQTVLILQRPMHKHELAFTAVLREAPCGLHIALVRVLSAFKFRGRRGQLM